MRQSTLPGAVDPGVAPDTPSRLSHASVRLSGMLSHNEEGAHGATHVFVKDISEDCGVTQERVRHIEATAFGTLRRQSSRALLPDRVETPSSASLILDDRRSRHEAVMGLDPAMCFPLPFVRSRTSSSLPICVRLLDSCTGVPFVAFRYRTKARRLGMGQITIGLTGSSA